MKLAVELLLSSKVTSTVNKTNLGICLSSNSEEVKEELGTVKLGRNPSRTDSANLRRMQTSVRALQWEGLYKRKWEGNGKAKNRACIKTQPLRGRVDFMQ